jgi:hypothetical protein
VQLTKSLAPLPTHRWTMLPNSSTSLDTGASWQSLICKERTGQSRYTQLTKQSWVSIGKELPTSIGHFHLAYAQPQSCSVP